MVVLPEPVWPTRAIVSPGSTCRSKSWRTGTPFDVVELDVVEVDAALDLLELEGVLAVADAGDGIEHLEDALATGHGALKHRVLHDEVADRLEEAQHEADEDADDGEGGADVDAVAAEGAHAGHDQHGADGDGDAHLDGRARQGR